MPAAHSDCRPRTFRELFSGNGGVAACALAGGCVILMVFGGCQTVKGVGKDISYAGEKTANLFEGGQNGDDQPRTLPQN